MRKLFILLATMVGLALTGSPVYATGGDDYHSVKDSKGCPNAEGWYTNPDEGDAVPTQKEDGFLFSGKDLIHRQYGPMDLADVKAGSFVAEGDTNKVVIKWETTAPYSSIIQTPDGKFWSSKVPSGKGSQSSPVDHVIDLTDPDVVFQVGKQYTGATKVVTVGVGYWTESGSTLVKSITFHGHTWKLSCEVEPSHSASPSASASHTTSPSPSHTGTVTPSRTRTSSPVPGAQGPSLPVTGPGIGSLVALGGVVVLAGAAAFWASRRRRTTFES